MSHKYKLSQLCPRPQRFHALWQNRIWRVAPFIVLLFGLSCGVDGGNGATVNDNTDSGKDNGEDNGKETTQDTESTEDATSNDPQPDDSASIENREPDSTQTDSPDSDGVPGDSDATPDSEEALESTPIAELVAAYIAKEIGLAQFTSASLDALADTVPGTLPSVMDGVMLLTADKTYTAATDVKVPTDSILVLQPGAKVVLGAGVTMDIQGQLFVLGTVDSPASIVGEDSQHAFETIRLSGGQSELHGCIIAYGQVLLSIEGTGETPIEVENCWLDSWVGDAPNALVFNDADGLLFHHNQVGVETPTPDIQGETVHGENSSAMIQNNVFGKRIGYNDVMDIGPCKEGHVPRIVSNEFLGGHDDGIDLDNCIGIVAGNYIHDFIGGEGSANGGCLTGDGDSQILVVNNILDNCVHAIGYKGDVRALLLNNTVVNSDEGFRPLGNAQVEAIGNIFWDNQVDSSSDPEGYLTASFNLLDVTGVTGTDENMNADPLFTQVHDIPFGLGTGSPAVGYAYGDLDALESKTIFSRQVLESFLGIDFFGTVRPLPQLDLGAISH